MAAQPKAIGFVGVGVMGGPMAQRLLERGYRLIEHDVDPAALKRLTRLGARGARSPREVADRAQTVLVSLPTPQIVREVALGDKGIVRGRAIKTFIDLSTTGSRMEMEIAQALAVRRIDTVDAPVSGGASGAAKGTLAVIAAGKPRAIAGVRDVLDVFGKVFVVGRRDLTSFITYIEPWAGVQVKGKKARAAAKR